MDLVAKIMLFKLVEGRVEGKVGTLIWMKKLKVV